MYPGPLTAGPNGHAGQPAAGQSPTARFNAVHRARARGNGDGEHGSEGHSTSAWARWCGTTRTRCTDPKTEALRSEVVGNDEDGNGGTTARHRIQDDDRDVATRHGRERGKVDWMRNLTLKPLVCSERRGEARR